MNNINTLAKPTPLEQIVSENLSTTHRLLIERKSTA